MGGRPVPPSHALHCVPRSEPKYPILPGGEAPGGGKGGGGKDDGPIIDAEVVDEKK